MHSPPHPTTLAPSTSRCVHLWDKGMCVAALALTRACVASPTSPPPALQAYVDMQIGKRVLNGSILVP